MELAVAFMMLLLPIVLLIGFYLMAVMVLATAMVYIKAGRPAWLSLVPVYSFVEMLDIVGLSVWWGLVVAAMSAISAATLFICLCTDAGFALYLLLQIILCVSTLGFTGYFSYRLARSFGESGWYAFGYVLLPIVFFPMLGFGKSKYKGSKKKNADTQKNKLIVTGILTVSLCALVAMSFVFMFAGMFEKYPAEAASSYTYQSACYEVVDGSVYHPLSDTYLPTSADTFQDLSSGEVDGLCYGRDSDAVFFGTEIIKDADPETFRFLGIEGFYVADDRHVYSGAEVIPYADPKNFTDLGRGYGKGKSTVFYATLQWNSNVSFSDLSILEGADAETFQLADEWNTTYDAFDKNNRYSFGVTVEDEL